MANSFNHSKLKKRITMMLKEKSSPWARLKYLYVLPVAAIAVTAFARPEVSNELKEISEVKVNDLVAIVETKAQETLVETEQQKETVAVRQETTNSEPEKKPAEQVISVRMQGDFVEVDDYFIQADNASFEVAYDEDGSPYNYIQLEGSRIVANKYPVTVTANHGDSIKVVGYGLMDAGAGNFQVHGLNNPPLIIIDGKESSQAVLNGLNVEAIDVVSVLKEETALAAYGDKGRNGVIIVDLKEPDALSATATKVITKAASQSSFEGVVFLVDGKRMETIDHIDQNSIESIDVCKNSESADDEIKALFKQYGSEAANGIIQVKLKK